MPKNPTSVKCPKTQPKSSDNKPPEGKTVNSALKLKKKRKNKRKREMTKKPQHYSSTVHNNNKGQFGQITQSRN
ncbi:hypothetical protein TorRG33x02_070230 [Trema orientale]|uniref:Uncharacterized protein n=1 Tax=Trema orientale TaxID=63057 RepID=A0A2P5FHJ7_TREOI|nr:hypothetical protein TorRG33x02_070230 [Trema orientale]